jgi:oleate hydratase
MEFRRYLNRKLDLLAGQLNTSQILQAPFNQYQAFIEPLAAWLLSHGVNLLTETFVRCIGFAPLPGRITVDRVDYEHRGTASSAAIAPEDIVLVTTGSQVADLSLGSMTEAPTPRDTRRSWALWKRLYRQAVPVGRIAFSMPIIATAASALLLQQLPRYPLQSATFRAPTVEPSSPMLRPTGLKSSNARRR